MQNKLISPPARSWRGELRLSAYAYSLTPQKGLLANLLKEKAHCAIGQGFAAMRGENGSGAPPALRAG